MLDFFKIAEESDSKDREIYVASFATKVSRSSKNVVTSSLRVRVQKRRRLASQATCGKGKEKRIDFI